MVEMVVVDEEWGELIKSSGCILRAGSRVQHFVAVTL